MCFTSREDKQMAQELEPQEEPVTTEPAAEEHSPEAPAADERERELVTS